MSITILRDQTYRELVNGPLHFNKRSQLFVGPHYESLPPFKVQG